MGGIGSGWHGRRGGKAVTAPQQRLTISGLFYGSLWRDGIGCQSLDADTIAISRAGIVLGIVRIDRTPHRPGGTRRWFLCPCCGRRCAVTYILRLRIACRDCHGLAYASQHETFGARKARRLVRSALAGIRSSIATVGD